MAEPLPTRDEINVFDSLDERCAVEHFLGKSLVEAEALFRENFLYYQEDLMFMGARAFCFYVRAAINFLRDPESQAGCDDVSIFLTDVEFRLDWCDAGDDVSPSIPAIREGMEQIISQWDRYGCDSAIIVENYGDVRRRCLALLERLRNFRPATS